jgi:hypothetical protein
MKRPESREVEESRSREEGREGVKARGRDGGRGAEVGLPAAHFNPSAVSLGEASLSEPGISTPAGPPPVDAPAVAPGVETPGHAPGIAGSVSLNPPPSTLNPGIAFIETRLHTLSDDVLAEECRVWSVPAREIDAFNRAEARRAWSFRNRLTPEGQRAFDERPAGLRLQLAELYFEVMTAEIATVERPPVAPIDRLAGRELSDTQSARAAGGSVD